MSERLHDSDLEILVGAIEGLSAKLDAQARRPISIDTDRLAQVIVALNADTRDAAAARLHEATVHLKQATDRIDTENEAARQKVLFKRVEAMRETGRQTSRKRLWQGIAAALALLLLAALLAGPWLAHGYFVRTASGCFALGGHYEAAAIDEGYRAFCAFIVDEP